ncbi:MAG: protein kinase, partial [Proteobacteria bacterium]|nr:protein kinase [Pseudomonadota bacterium]
AGRTIGRYEIVSVLGQGGFGITYRARDTQLGREVAIKEYLPSALAVRQADSTVLPRSTKMSDDFTWGRQRFVEEGRTLATLQRAPAIVRVFDFLEANGTAYIVMELVPGETLEDRLKGGRTLSPEAVERILWPLLEGLEQVHATGFLHRDIKPANILLDEAGHPTLIDFGASRAAMAGRTTAMTAIFTPGYAAAEQFTSAKQGPWTDIYGIAATMYHAITGGPPPSAFDRMLEDDYRALVEVKPAGFAPGLLVGLDAGLAVRAQERPQSIAGWRLLLRGAAEGEATVALGRGSDPNATVLVRGTASPAAAASAMPPPGPSSAPGRSRLGLWLGLGAVAAVMLGGGGYYVVQDRAEQAAVQQAAQEKVAQEQAAQEQAARDQETRRQAAELARLKAEKEARDKADAEAAQRQQIEAETRQKVEAELAAKQQAEEQARQQAAADEAARHKADEDARRTAESTEAGLRLTTTDRQHVQVALTALGFNTNGSDGVFGGHTRDMIAAWQKGRNEASTGFLTGAQNQALQRDAAPAIAKFDDDQKKAEEARKKADDDKAKADAAAKAAAQTQAAAASASAAIGADGLWRGSMHCTANRNAGPFNAGMEIRIVGGSGTWVRPGSGPGTSGNQSISVKVSGNQVAVHRTYVPINNPNAPLQTTTLAARLNGNTISGSGPEANSGGRTCEFNLDRVGR